MISSSCLWIERSLIVLCRLETVVSLIFWFDMSSCCLGRIGAGAGVSEREMCWILAWVFSCFFRISRSDHRMALRLASVLLAFNSFLVSWSFISFEFKMTYPRNHKINYLNIIISLLLYLFTFSFITKEYSHETEQLIGIRICWWAKCTFQNWMLEFNINSWMESRLNSLTEFIKWRRGELGRGSDHHGLSYVRHMLTPITYVRTSVLS